MIVPGTRSFHGRGSARKRASPPGTTEPRRIPRATYRLQFRGGFGFRQARDLLPYLQALGVTDVYLSPVFRARLGSRHGYDVTDPTRFDPVLGKPQEFHAFAAEAARRGMGLILDIVPNHMAVSFENRYWRDVLENGPSSRYGEFFDISWDQEEKGNPKLLIPCLGKPYGRALEDGELRLDWSDQGFLVRYWDHSFPLDPKTWNQVLPCGLSEFSARWGSGHPALAGLREVCSALERIPPRSRTDSRSRRERLQARRRLVRSIRRLRSRHQEVREYFDEITARVNGRQGDPRSFDVLDRLLEAQSWRLAYWKVATEAVGYRRFFDISDLVGVRVELDRVLSESHALILRLARENAITGLRIDHIDGLYDPAVYLHRLQNHLSPGREPEARPFYIVVEKILIGDETLPEDWPIHGTTGYDGLSAIQEVFVDPAGFGALQRSFVRYTGRHGSFWEQVHRDNRRVLQGLLSGEVGALARQLARLAKRDRHARHLSRRALERALTELTALLPVYRTYIRDFSVRPADRTRLEAILEDLGRRHPEVGTDLRAFLRRLLLLEIPHYLGPDQREDWLRFVMHWQQLTSPAMAKGLEDTTHYIHTPLLSLNEVGGEPGVSSDSVEHFHEYARLRSRAWRHAMVATSTHDSKRSEDVRARLNVLSELAREWSRRFLKWRRLNEHLTRRVRRIRVPAPVEEWILYQTLVGAWPLDPTEEEEFLPRVRGFMIKAAREAKLYTSWLRPSEEYEKALTRFVEEVLAPSNEAFLRDFRTFQGKIAWYGAINSLAQVVLKSMSPGVPDFYQGTELWDFSLVDPDNRRPVDFELRRQRLQELVSPGFRESEESLGLLRDRWTDGGIKLYVTRTCLNLRARHPEVFSNGDYIPLFATGGRAAHLCAFARRNGKSWVVVAVPRLVASMVAPGVWPVGRSVWGAGALVLPAEAPRRWRNAATGREVDRRGKRATAGSSRSSRGAIRIPLSSLFTDLPVVMLEGETR